MSRLDAPVVRVWAARGVTKAAQNCRPQTLCEKRVGSMCREPTTNHCSRSTHVPAVIVADVHVKGAVACAVNLPKHVRCWQGEAIIVIAAY